MAVIDRSVPKPTFWRRVVEKFWSAFLSLGLPIVGIVILSIAAVVIRDFPG